MIDAVADCLVTGYEDLIDGLKLPDPDDRHVLAAAIRASAQEIANSRRRLPQTAEDILAELEHAGLVRSVTALRSPPS
jgi:hypothetical protein